MAAPTVRAYFSDAANTGSNSSFNMVLPAGIQAGDWAVVLVSTNSASANLTGMVETGWTLVDGRVSSSTVLGAWLFAKAVGAADSSTSISCALDVPGRWTYSGEVLASTPQAFDRLNAAAVTTSDSTTMNIPAITPVAADTLVTALAASRYSTTTTGTSAYTQSYVKRVEPVTNNSTAPKYASALANKTVTGQAGIAQPAATATYAGSARGIVWTFTVASGSPLTPTNASVTGVAAGSTTTGVTGAVAAVAVAVLTGLAAVTGTGAVPGTVNAVQVATLTGTPAASVTSAPPGVVTTVQNVSSAGVPAASSTSAVPGAVSASAARLIDQGFEAFTPGTDVTSASGFTPSKGTGTTLKYANDLTMFGAVTMKATYSSAAAYGTATFPAQTTAYLRWYDYLDTPPAATVAIASLLTSTPSVSTRGQVAVDSLSRPILRNGTTNAATGTTNVVGQLVRYEWEPTGSTQTLRVYIGANAGGSTPDETLTAAFVSGGFDSLRLGVVNSTGNAGSTWVDEVAVDTASQPGPVTSVVSASITGVAASAVSGAVAAAVTGVRFTSSTGVGATSTTAAIPGSVVGVRNVTITGVAGTSSTAATTGSVGSTRTVALSGTAAASTTAAVTSAVVAVRVVTLTGATTATSTGAIPGVVTVVAAAGSAAVTGAPASSATAARAGTVTAVRHATLTGDTPATSTTALAGTVTAAQQVTVDGASAESTTDTLAYDVTGVQVAVLDGAAAETATAATAGDVAVTRAAIVTPASRRLIIAAEPRTATIGTDVRVVTVAAERRTKVVTLDARTSIIPAENRTVTA